jgi:hypothetical protein
MKKATFITVLSIAIITAVFSLCLIAQSIYFYILNIQLQLAQFGFTARHVSLLTFGQQVSESICSIVGVLLAMVSGVLFVVITRVSKE